jgi:hypothetical protein
LGLFRFFRLGSSQFASHLESAGQPEQGMEAADGESAHKQSCHSPEGIKEKGILAGVVMRGVSQVSSEAPIGARMTLLAGGGHVGAA